MRTRVGVLALMALLSAACGKIKGGASDAAPGPDATTYDAAPPDPCDPGANPTADEAYTCMMQAACTAVTRCFLPFTIEQCMGQDIEIFENGAGVFRHRPLVLEDIDADRIEYDPEAVADCYARVAGLECPVLFEHAIDNFSISNLCPDVFVGTVPASETCYTALECEGQGAVCQYGKCTEDSFCCAGTCVPPAAVDDPCGANPCVVGAYCVDGICRAGDANAPCISTANCAVGLWCSDGTCQAELDTGADCTNYEECPGPEVCLIAPDAPAGTCARIDQANAMCNGRCYGFECVQPDEAALGTCQPYLVEGDDCSGDLSCSGNYECNPASDQCDLLGSVGDACSNDAGNGCMPQLFCDREISGATTGICSERLADGEHCADDEGFNNRECQSDVCVGETGSKTCQPYPGCFE